MKRQGAARLLTTAMLAAMVGTGTEARADGPGLGNLTYTSSDLYKIIKEFDSTDGYSNVFMHRGYMVGLPAPDSGKAGGGIDIWNVSNPRSPTKILFKRDSVTNPLREPHGMGVRGDFVAFQSTKGIQIWNFAPLGNATAALPTLVKDMTLSGIQASDYDAGNWWTTWAGNYIVVAGSSNGIFVINATDPANPVVVKHMPTGTTGGFRANQVFPIGNVLIVAGNQTGTGWSIFDFQDPANPVMLGSQPDATDSYSLYVAGKHRGSGTDPLNLYIYTRALEVFDITSLNSFPRISGTASDDGIGYLSYQDGFIHGGYSGKYYKFNVTNPASVSKTATVSQNSTHTTNHEDWDFGMVLGNLVYIGNDHATGTSGKFIVHQMAPDTTGPRLGYINPVNGATNQKTTTRVGMVFSDIIDSRTLTSSNIIVRPVGGSAMPGKYSVNYQIVNFQPDTPFTAGTTYEVVITTGVKDVMGNSAPADAGGSNHYVSTFTIAGGAATAPTGCTISSNASGQNGSAYLVDSTDSVAVTFTASGCTGTGLTYSWTFGDGAAATAFSATNTGSKTYTYPNHYPVTVTVKNSGGMSATFNKMQTVVYQPTHLKTGGRRPNRASPITYDNYSTRNRVVAVSPDNNTVTSFDAATDTSSPSKWTAIVGKNPRTVAVNPTNGEVWVACQDEGSVRILDGANGAYLATIWMPRGSRPFGVTFAPAGGTAYVTLEGTGELAKLDAVARTLVSRIAVGPKARGLAITGDGNRIFVSRFISPAGNGEVYEVWAPTFAKTHTITIAADSTTVDTEAAARGVPNYLQSLTVSPDGRRLAVPSKKDNIYRGMLRDGKQLNFENTVRSIVSLVNLKDYAETDVRTEALNLRRDINNGDLAMGAVYTSLGDYVFVPTQNGMVAVYDALNYNSTNLIEVDTSGVAPQGVAMKPDDSRLYVFNFMSRTVDSFDVTNVGVNNQFVKKATVALGGTELLATNVLEGKKIFYNSKDTRMAKDEYMACSSCHLEGAADERVWDFTGDGEGLRNTISLLGRRGMGHGPVHWTANFDEIQDFEHPIRKMMGGTGFMTDGQLNTGTRNQPLGDPKAGVAPDLDKLAAYVESLATVPPSPHRNANGTLTSAAASGKTKFDTACASCHKGRDFTDSAEIKLHNVGTTTSSSGKRLGQTLTGLDTPTLLGVWDTSPYLHDGSVNSLATVLNNTTHVGTLTAGEKTNLEAYLKQIDDTGRDINVTAFTVNDTANAADWSLQGDLSVGDPSHGDRAHIWTTVPSIVNNALWIRPANDSKAATNNPLVTFTVDKAVEVYVAWDDRNTTKPAWLDATWVDTTQNIVQRDAASLNSGTAVTYAMSVYKKNFAAGSVSLGPSVNTNNMYTVMLKPQAATAAPAAPTSLAAVAGTMSVSLTWAASANATSYNVKRSTTSGSGYTTIATGVAGTSYTNNSGLTAGTTYYYVVTAVNGAGESGNSNQASGVPTCTLPSVPTGLSLTAGNGQVTASWTSVANATGYKVYRGTSSGSINTLAGSPTGNLYTNTGLTNGTTYWFAVSSTNSCGESAKTSGQSAVPTTTTTAKDALLIVADNLAPRSEDVAIRDRLVSLGYTVTYVDDSDATTSPTGKKLIFISNSVTAASVGARFDTTAVPVINAEGGIMIDMRMANTEDALNSNQTTLNITNASSPLAAGLSGMNTISSTGVGVVTAQSLASGKVTVAYQGTSSTKVAIASFETGATLLSGTAPARRVLFFLGENAMPSLTSAGLSLFDAAVSWATGAVGTMSLSASGTNGIGTINLSWGAVSGATYTVKRSLTSGSGFAQIASGLTGTTYADNTVDFGKTYYYVVDAIVGGALNNSSSEASAMIKPVALLVVGNKTALTADDNAVKGRLENSLGFVVSVGDDNDTDLNTTQLNNKQLVVAQTSCDSTVVATKLTAVAKPVLLYEAFGCDTMGMTTADPVDTAGQTQVTVVNPSSPLAGSMTGTVTVLGASSTMSNFAASAIGANADKVMSLAGNTSQIVEIAYEAGATMSSGTAPARRVCTGINGGWANMTATGFAIVDAAVKWAADL